MKIKNDISRLTIDLPKANHKLLKAMAAELGVSMKEIILESIDERIKQRKKEEEICRHSSHVPNKKTARAIKDVKEGKGLIRYENSKDFFKKFGKR